MVEFCYAKLDFVIIFPRYAAKCVIYIVTHFLVLKVSNTCIVIVVWSFDSEINRNSRLCRLFEWEYLLLDALSTISCIYCNFDS